MVFSLLACTAGTIAVDAGTSDSAAPVDTSAAHDTGSAPSDTGPDDSGSDDTALDDTGVLDRSPFSIIVLPDTQNYAESYPETFTEQTAWIVDVADERNVLVVLHEGDITDDNDDEQWGRADASMSRLDGVVPWVAALGNHDLGPGGDGSDRSTDFDTWFPRSDYVHEPWYGGHMEGRAANHYAVFERAGLSWLFLSLEFGPSDAMLDWASEVITSHPDHRVAITTHCYLHSDNALISGNNGYSPHNYGVEAYGVNDGQEMWDELVSLHENIYLVVSGHVAGAGAGRLTSQGLAGNDVHQVLANFQGWDNGGDGWLRVMTFVPDEDRIDVETFSPTLYAASDGAEGVSDHPDHVFSLPYDMSL